MHFTFEINLIHVLEILLTTWLLRQNNASSKTAKTFYSKSRRCSKLCGIIITGTTNTSVWARSKIYLMEGFENPLGRGEDSLDTNSDMYNVTQQIQDLLPPPMTYAQRNKISSEATLRNRLQTIPSVSVYQIIKKKCLKLIGE